jgi:hypothetical protein
MMFDVRRGIILAGTAQIHFPRDQIGRLTSVLDDIRVSSPEAAQLE